MRDLAWAMVIAVVIGALGGLLAVQLSPKDTKPPVRWERSSEHVETACEGTNLLVRYNDRDITVEIDSKRCPK